MGQFRDGVTMNIIEPAGDIAGLDVRDNDAELGRTHRSRKRLAPVAEQKKDIRLQFRKDRRQSLDAAPERLCAVERLVAVAAEIDDGINFDLRTHLVDRRAEYLIEVHVRSDDLKLHRRVILDQAHDPQHGAEAAALACKNCHAATPGRGLRTHSSRDSCRRLRHETQCDLTEPR